MSTPTMAAPGAPVVDLDLAELRRDPYPAYAALRRTAPVAWVPSVGRHLLTRYEDIVHAEIDGFVPALDSDYDGVATMIRGLGG